ncbi:adhesion G-protein coupled receptor G6-like, partial [Engraulis encrasicolus]|uniref:adhesion G-protein coupled receptor G6-like n=1 Tax=Engraulis encrasicolus TaxID=184585 RepID=UPI002FCF0787
PSMSPPTKGNWTEDGCTTLETGSTITCQCSHLTFFAILMSLPGNGTISESDLSSLTYISYIGCGLSLFFLGVALFMHFLLRKGKSSQSVQVLMNVFLALFLLNLTFLTNEFVANTGSYVGCVIIAMLMHYSMLATFTWFAMQALHLYLHLVMMLDIKTFKHYMLKMCLPAWICPALAVIVIACLGKYEEISISTDTGYQAKMCWTKDILVHYAVNIGYFALVFLFSMGIFVVMVQRICAARKMQSKDVKQPPISKNLSIIMSLLFLLGITWGVAFFSYGPMLIPSYYIFCILNSFQGLFLFIYYYNNSRDLPENLTSTKSSVSSNTSVSNIYSNSHG